MTKNENFGPNFLNIFSESIQNVSKRILNLKSRLRKKIRLKIFLLDSTVFDENGYMVNIFDQNF